MSEKKTFAIYSRKSRFTGKGESIENQLEMCREYIRNYYGEREANNAFIYEDEGYSGKNLDRPQFQKMLQSIRENKHNAIVVYRLDRISRNVGDFANLIDELNHKHVSFISVREQFDTTTPMGKAMLYISSVFANLERETIAERIRDNMYELAKTGRWLGGNTPTGYSSEQITSVTIDGREKKLFKLVLNPDEMKLVELVYDKFIETNSLSQTEKYLLEKKILTKNGNYFTRYSIRAILTNPVYMIADDDAYHYFADKNIALYSDKNHFDGVHGMMTYNRTFQETGKSNKTKPIDEWIICVGKHEGIISGRKWIDVQDKLEQNKSKAYRKPRSHTALLSGLLICGNCGSFMRPKMTQRKNKDGESIYTYICSLKERSNRHRCYTKNINGNFLDNYVLDQVIDSINDTDIFQNGVKIALGNIKRNSRCFQDEIKKIKAEINKAEKAKKNYIKNLGISDDEKISKIITEEIKSIQTKIENLQEEITKIKETSYETVNFEPNEAMITLAQKIFTTRDFVELMTVIQKREFIRILVEKIIWDGEMVHVVCHGSDFEYSFPAEPKVLDYTCSLSEYKKERP